MKILSLIIKQKYFDEIIAGTKTQETREIKLSTEKKYVLHDNNGYALQTEEGNSIPIKYDAIRFYVGYNKNRDTALVEVKNAYTTILTDENNEVIQYQLEDGSWFIVEIITYDLGKIIEVKKADK